MNKIFWLIKTAKYIFVATVVFSVSWGSLPMPVNADLPAGYGPLGLKSEPTILNNGHITLCKLDESNYEVVRKIKMIVTAYSSTPEQTDDTPFITASGKQVADGILANNMLPFGTKVRMPELYGDKVFVVQDRMHQRKGLYHADVWMATYQEAKDFGAKITNIEVIES